MCGIVGLYLKNQSLQSQLGEMFVPMLIAMSDRGPDSAGFAVYHDPATGADIKLTVQSDTQEFDWLALVTSFESRFGSSVSCEQNANSAVLSLSAAEEAVRNFIESECDGITLMSIGRSIEIRKGVGLPADICDRFDIASMQGSHVIGHTRMATESAVTTEGSHPFSTGMDLCLVHNGSFSNHNRLREELKEKGLRFETENDSEVAAGFLTWRLKEGDSLHEALNRALRDLDGFYTLAIGTEDGFAVLRDPIACKPAVMAETEDYVAIASEYQSLAHLPGIEKARLWEPEPAVVYVWGDQKAA